MRLANLADKRFRLLAIAFAAVAVLVAGPSCFAADDHPEFVVGIWTVKSHLLGEDQKESTSENEKIGATFKFRKDGTWKVGESNDYLYWAYAESTKEMETWDTIFGKKAKGTICHYDVELSKDGKSMTWKVRNMFGIKQKIAFEKK